MPKFPLKTARKFKRNIVLLSLAIAIYIHISTSVVPVLKKVSVEEVKALTSSALNSSAQTVMSNNLAYASLVKIEHNSAGEIEALITNTVLVNDVARQTVYEAQKSINKIGEKGIKVPIGSLVGITFFSGMGPSVNIKVRPIGTVNMDYSSVFDSVGINQTRHRIILHVICRLNVVLSGATQNVEVSSEILLTESIIVGKIPEIYLKSSTDKINIVP